jgi:hypothetical protein
VWFFLLRIWLARNGAKTSVASRSAVQRLAGADPASGSRPDPEVVAKPKRRTYTAEYKQRILEEAEAVGARWRAGRGSRGRAVFKDQTRLRLPQECY